MSEIFIPPWPSREQKYENAALCLCNELVQRFSPIKREGGAVRSPIYKYENMCAKTRLVQKDVLRGARWPKLLGHGARERWSFPTLNSREVIFESVFATQLNEYGRLRMPNHCIVSPAGELAGRRGSDSSSCPGRLDTRWRDNQYTVTHTSPSFPFAHFSLRSC